MLPHECAVRCMQCNGRGAVPDPALERCDLHDRNDQTCPAHDWCLACHNGEFPCAAHRCGMCSGSGTVCPHCQGMRMVVERRWSPGMREQPIRLCTVCMESKTEINDTKERRAIEQYLTRWYARQRGAIAAVATSE